MTRRDLSLLVLCLLALLLSAAAKMMPHELPAGRCGELYQRYAGRPGIEAAYLRDYRLNDSVSVAVTLFRATDSAAWQQLCSDFAIYLPEELRGTKTFFVKGKGTRNFGTDLPDSLIDILEEKCISYSYHEQEVIILHIDSEEQEKLYLHKLAKDAIPETYKHKHKIT